jgi:hypothetical protein
MLDAKPAAGAAGARLIVGVTAHRDLVPELVPQLEATVRAWLQRLRGTHPDLPLAVMSALAEGGDRLVARCALDLGIPLIAPLPMPLADYLGDFPEPASRAEFEALLARAEVVELPLVPGTVADALHEMGPARDRQYAQLGVYVSSHCQVLLALWDRRAPSATGGTAEVVHYHLHGEMPGLAGEDAPPNLLADDDSDLVYHIACPRDRPQGGIERPLHARWLTRNGESPGDGPMPEAYRRLFHQLGEFNADARKYAADIEAEPARLLPDDPAVPVPPAARAIEAMFARADWLAIHFRQRVQRSLLVVHVLAVVTGLLLMVYSELLADRTLLAAVLALFAFGVVVARIGQRREWHRRYLDYRVLAEGLRVQAYWTIAGVPAAHRVRFAYDSFLQKQDVELGWIRHVMRGVHLGGGPFGSEAGLDWVVDHWVGDGGVTGQWGYYRRRRDERERRHRTTEAVGRASLGLSLAGATALLLAAPALGGLANWVLVLTAVAALFAGVREAYSHKRADKELIKQYRFMARVFEGAAQRLAAATSPEARRRVLEALGQAALEEHAEWILMHRERPLEHGRLG